MRRFDPWLFRTALFAAPDRREALLILYAFDVELSRAAHRPARSETGPLLAQMRLQWWRDLVASARAGGASPEAPLARAVHGLVGSLAKDTVDGLMSAREMELDAPFDRARFDAWCQARFGGLVALAIDVLAPEAPGPDGAVAKTAGTALGTAFALRHARAMAGEGSTFVPDLATEALGTLARGESLPTLDEPSRKLASQALQQLRETRRQHRQRVDGRAIPALLPLIAAERVLAQAARQGVSPASADPSGLGLTARLVWRAATGRW